MSDFEQQIGKLSVGTTRSGGKVVDKWRFVSPFTGNSVKSDKTPALEVEISINKTDRDEIVFRAAGTCLRAPISDTDINRLKDAVETELRLQHNLLTAVQWEDWLQVRVAQGINSQGRDAGASTGLDITYTRLKRGIDPRTGHIFTINRNGYASDFPLAKKAGEEDLGVTVGKWEGMHKRDRHTSYSYIPETPQSIAALDDIMSKMEELRNRLACFLEQDAISTSLMSRDEGFPALVFSDKMDLA